MLIKTTTIRCMVPGVIGRNNQIVSIRANSRFAGLKDWLWVKKKILEFMVKWRPMIFSIEYQVAKIFHYMDAPNPKVKFVATKMTSYTHVWWDNL